MTNIQTSEEKIATLHILNALRQNNRALTFMELTDEAPGLKMAQVSDLLNNLLKLRAIKTTHNGKRYTIDEWYAQQWLEKQGQS